MTLYIHFLYVNQGENDTAPEEKVGCFETNYFRDRKYKLTTAHDSASVIDKNKVVSAYKAKVHVQTVEVEDF